MPTQGKVSSCYPEYYGFFAWLQNAPSELHVLEGLGDFPEGNSLET